MGTGYTYGENYYIELSKEKLDEILDEMLVSIVGYKKDEEHTYGSKCFNIMYLDNGNVLCNIQLRNSIYVNNNCVVDYISSEYFDLAKYQYQVNEFVSEDEGSLYKPVMINNPEYVEGGNKPEFIEKRDADGNVLFSN